MISRCPGGARLLLAAFAALALHPVPARADLITPDSILRPPPATVGSADGTPITSSADLVSNQYAPKGLLFLSSPGPAGGLGSAAAVASVGGVNAWIPAQHTEALASAVGVVNYGNSLMIQLVRPGTTIATLAGSVTVESVGGVGILNAYDAGGHLLGTATSGAVGPHGGTLLSVSAAGISWFTVSGPPIPLGGGGTLPPAPPWGVAQVSFTPVAAPEPGALTLACLGALGLAVRAGRRKLLPKH